MQTLIASPGFEYLAEEIVAKYPGKIVHGKVNFRRFPDGTPNFSFGDVKHQIEHQEVTYIADFTKPELLYEHYNLLFNLVKNIAAKIRIIMPYFPVGTSERVDRDGETESAHAFAHLISSLPSGTNVKNSVHIFDIHVLMEQSLFNPDRIIAQSKHTTTNLMELQPGEVIAFPDDGAAKRFRDIHPEAERIICGKVRIGDKRQITIKEGSPTGKKVIIIDDLIQTGGTLIETASELRKQGALQVRAFAPHGVFPNQSHLRVASALDELIVTDSIPANIERAKDCSNMQVVSIVPLVEKILLRGA